MCWRLQPREAVQAEEARVTGGGQGLSLVPEMGLRGVSCELTAAHPEETIRKPGWENACNTALKTKYFQNLQSKKRTDNMV